MDNKKPDKIVTCMQCGWIGKLSEADNGEYEPPTCLYCESGQLRYDTNSKNDQPPLQKEAKHQ